MTAADPADAARPAPFRPIVPLTVACALFMETLDTTVIATAVPAIARDLGVPPLTLSLALTAYLLSLAVFIPVSGRLADRYGSRRVFTAALGVFTLASALCGLAGSLPELVAARVLQGMGGAMMMPVGRLALLRSVAKADYVRAMSFLTVPALLGPSLGPIVGGLIVTNASWRWIFYINLPIGLLGILLARRYLPDVRGEAAGPPDIRGYLLVGAGLAGLVFGLESVGRGAVPPGLAVAAVLAACALLLAYGRHARGLEHPALELRLFRLPTFRAAVLGGLVCRMGFGAVPFLLPLLFQLGFGLSPLHSGALTAVVGAGALTMKLVAPRLVRAFGFRRLLIGNAVAVAGVMAGFAAFERGTPDLVILAVLALFGFLRALQFTGLNALGYADVTPGAMSAATSLTGVGQQLSISLGVALGATALHLVTALGGGGGGGVPGPEAFRTVFLILALLPLLALPWFVRLPPDAGAAVSDHVLPRRRPGRRVNRPGTA